MSIGSRDIPRLDSYLEVNHYTDVRIWYFCWK